MVRRWMVVAALAATAAQAQDVSKAREGNTNRTAECSAVETLLHDHILAVRTYDVPPPKPGAQNDSWDQAPYVKSVMHCGDLYIFVVLSRSKNPWVINRARVEGPAGVLQVVRLGFRALQGWSNNIIMTEAPPDEALPSLELHLSGEDGRVARLEARDLP